MDTNIFYSLPASSKEAANANGRYYWQNGMRYRNAVRDGRNVLVDVPMNDPFESLNNDMSLFQLDRYYDQASVDVQTRLAESELESNVWTIKCASESESLFEEVSEPKPLDQLFSASEKSFPCDAAVLDPKTRVLLNLLKANADILTCPVDWRTPENGVLNGAVKSNQTTGSKSFQYMSQKLCDAESPLYYERIDLLTRDHKRNVVLCFEKNEKSVTFFAKGAPLFVYSLEGWTIEQVRDFFGGFWFERYVREAILKWKEENGYDLEYVQNVCFDGKELDLVLRFGGVFYVFVEVKSGRFPDDDAVILFEEKVRNFAEDPNNRSLIVRGVFACLQDDFIHEEFLDAISDSKFVGCLHGSKLEEMIGEDALLNVRAGEIWA